MLDPSCLIKSHHCRSKFQVTSDSITYCTREFYEKPSNLGDDVGGIRASAYAAGRDKSFFHLPTYALLVKLSSFASRESKIC